MDFHKRLTHELIGAWIEERLILTGVNDKGNTTWGINPRFQDLVKDPDTLVLAKQVYDRYAPEYRSQLDHASVGLLKLNAATMAFYVALASRWHDRAFKESLSGKELTELAIDIFILASYIKEQTATSPTASSTRLV